MCSRLARDLQSERNSLPQAQDTKHPVDAYVGLRRFTQYWSKYISRLGPVVAHSGQYLERDRDRQRDTDRQTDRQTDRDTERDTEILDKIILL